MLAPNEKLKPIADYLPIEPGLEPQREYSDFPWWHVLLVEPNREERSAIWLKRFHVHVYLPVYTKQVRRRGRDHKPRLYATIPGMLFVPQEMMDIERRDEVLLYAHARGFIRSSDGLPALVPKFEIEKVRIMEAKMNLPPEAKGVFFKVGQSVRFVDDMFEGWGIGTIIEIASEVRIGVEVKKLFGRATKVYVPAAEIEAM